MVDRRVVKSALALLVLAAPAFALDPVGPGAEAVQACARRNLPSTTAEQEIVLEREDRTGKGQRIEARGFWKRKGDRSRFLVRVEAPPDLRDSAFLLLERDGASDMFTYVPELRTVRRITARTLSGSLFGTDFSYEDMQQLQSTASNGEVARLPDATVDGRKAYVLSGKPARESGSAYEKIVSYVDAETCVTLKTELFAKGDRPSKVILAPADKIEKDGEIYRPGLIVVDDLDEQSRTRLTVVKARYDVDLSDRLFSEGELAKGH
jgi:hypothetical protein